MLFCIPKILKNESNSQLNLEDYLLRHCCFVSQRYWKMKAIHNNDRKRVTKDGVVLYPKDTEKWKQFTTIQWLILLLLLLFCIPKILKNESNSQLTNFCNIIYFSCFVSQRYWKMKAIHNSLGCLFAWLYVVLYPKDTEKWKQFTTYWYGCRIGELLFCIPKILKNESNSQHNTKQNFNKFCCFVSQRYWKMKAIHNNSVQVIVVKLVVLYPKDTEKWKQFTTHLLTT